MNLVYLLIFGFLIVLFIIGIVLLGIALKTFDSLLMKFIKVNQDFYINQNNINKNQQHALNKMTESILHTSMIGKSTEKLESIIKELKNAVYQIKLSNFKNTDTLKEVNRGKKTHQTSDNNSKMHS